LLLTDIGYAATKPSTAKTWSTGFDWTPPQWDGLDLAVNWHRVRYNNDVDTAIADLGYVSSINGQFLNPLIIYNPTYFPALAVKNPVAFVNPNGTNAATCSAIIGKRITTQALFNQYVGCLDAQGDGGILGAPANPSQVVAIEDSEHLNTTSIETDGLDFSVMQNWESGWGNWRAGAIAEYITDYNVSLLPGTPLVPEVSELGFPVQLKGRAQFGWDGKVGADALSATAFVNYTEGYHVPSTDLPIGVGSQYTHVASYTTVDLTFIYTIQDVPDYLLAKGITWTLSVQNLFDTPPPLVLNATAPGIRYDPSNASPLGRLIQFQLGVKF
jgi:iron complex outermembrane receptor protein